ncbi:hypothetical protein [Streptomyces sp. NPDC002078]
MRPRSANRPPGARPAVLPGTTHMALMRRTTLLLPLLYEFLD